MKIRNFITQAFVELPGGTRTTSVYRAEALRVKGNSLNEKLLFFPGTLSRTFGEFHQMSLSGIIEARGKEEPKNSRERENACFNSASS